MATIRNAESAGKTECVIRPASKLIGRVLKVMQDHEYIRSLELVEDGRGNLYRVGLVGSINNCGVIKPRFAVKPKQLEKYEARYLPAQDFRVVILTTTGGVTSQTTATAVDGQGVRVHRRELPRGKVPAEDADHRRDESRGERRPGIPERPGRRGGRSDRREHRTGDADPRL